MKSGHGSFNTNFTRRASTTWTSLIFSFKSLAAPPLYRSNENFTSSGVTGSPLWNLMFWRRRNV